MKSTKQISNGAIADGFARIVEKWHKVESTPQEYGTGFLLARSEIQLLETIGGHSGSSVTELAGLHAVTKGAISQTLKKLVTKGLAAKETDPSNTSRLLVELTPGGMKAYESYLDWHKAIGGNFKSYVEELSTSNTRFLIDFIDHLETFLDNRMEKGIK